MRFALIAVLIAVLIGPLAARAADPVPLPAESLLIDPIWARPGYAGLAQAFLNRTRYLLALEVDHARGLVRGRARVLYINSTPVALNSTVFRLYPNHPVHQGRSMTINAVYVNGAPVPGTLRRDNQTVYDVPFPAPVPPGSQTTIDFEYQITTPAGASFYYLAEPYPVAAIYDPQTGWREEVATKGLDYAFTESALFAVNIRAPARYGTWFNGALQNTLQSADGTNTYTVVTGPVRNFVLIQARGWQSFEARGAGVPVRVLYSGSPQVANEIATFTVAAMNYFDAVFTPYPYAGLDVVVMRFPSGGEEYPALLFINNERNTSYRRFITLHEVAHQWFYGIAGNDTLRHAWLDESLAQIAGFLFWRYGPLGNEGLAEEYWQSILTWYNRIQTVRPINTALDQFRDFPDYMSTVYGGGAVFLRELGQRIGDEALVRGLSAYVRAVNLGIGTPEEFFYSVQAQTPIDLRPVFCARVGIMC